ncbi:MAG: uracil-DNA glycosylase family protein [Acidobacteriota bacterium]
MSELRPDVAQALAYLEEIGYEDLYLQGQPSGDRNAPAKGEQPSAAPRKASEPVAAPPAPTRATPSAEPTAAPTDSVPPEVAQPSVAAPVGTAPAGTSPAGTAPAAAERAAKLETLAEQTQGCTACVLAEGRKKVVFGSGNPDADLMLIGEGPGAEEDRQGLPFVGPAGELLTKILKAIDLGRDEVYIANVVKCRPPQNRDPERDEVAACRGYLEQQIDFVQPRVIVALGRVAAQALLGTTDALGRLRGRWHDVRGVPTRATYHPAALLRYTTYKRPTWEDMQIVRDRLREG